jgi:hypothetical protein
MKKGLLFFVFLMLGMMPVFAQKTLRDDKGTAYLSSANQSATAKDARRSAEERSESYNKKMDKRVSRERKKLRKTNDCDCPGNPKSKLNKRNPYKRQRMAEEKKSSHRRSR